MSLGMLNVLGKRLLIMVAALSTTYVGTASALGVIKGEIHAANKAIVAQVMEEEIAALQPEASPQAKMLHLMHRIAVVADRLFESGFDTSAYTYGTLASGRYLRYVRIPLWEGGVQEKHDIPFTLLVYAWPTEDEACKATPSGGDNSYYGSNIHGHAIPCALTVMNRSIMQYTYLPHAVYRGTAVEFEKELLIPGIPMVDDNQDLFVHRLVCEEKGPAPCITLHAYGAGTADEVSRIFIDTYADYCYLQVMHDDGTFEQRKW